MLTHSSGEDRRNANSTRFPLSSENIFANLRPKPREDRGAVGEKVNDVKKSSPIEVSIMCILLARRSIFLLVQVSLAPLYLISYVQPDVFRSICVMTDNNKNEKSPRPASHARNNSLVGALNASTTVVEVGNSTW